jgi:hypothetical protein
MAGRLRISESGKVRRVRRARRRDEDDRLINRIPSALIRRMQAKGRVGLDALQRLAGRQRSDVAAHLAGQVGNLALQRMLLQREVGAAEAAAEPIAAPGEEGEETPAFEAPETWGERQTITVNDVSMEVYGATTERLRIIQDTLSLLPTEHIQQIPRIVVGDRVGPIGTGGVTRGGNSVNRGNEFDRLEITNYALDNRLRQAGRNGPQVCVSLLHEIGHWVDWRLTLLPPRNSESRRQLEEWFAGIDYQGVTQGAGERAAEAYWRYWVGTLPDEIREVIEATPAMEDLRALED